MILLMKMNTSEDVSDNESNSNDGEEGTPTNTYIGDVQDDEDLFEDDENQEESFTAKKNQLMNSLLMRLALKKKKLLRMMTSQLLSICGG